MLFSPETVRLAFGMGTSKPVKGVARAENEAPGGRCLSVASSPDGERRTPLVEIVRVHYRMEQTERGRAIVTLRSAARTPDSLPARVNRV